MPHKRIPPVSIEMMEDNRREGHFTICQKLREIYRQTTDEDIKLKCRVAMAMAKRMVNKLKEYKSMFEGQSNG